MKKIIQYVVCLLINFNAVSGTAQDNKGLPDTVSNYIYINTPAEERDPYNGKIVAFILTNIDTLGKTNWQSGKITAIEKEDTGYFVKVNIPNYVLKNSSGLWCRGLIEKVNDNGVDTSSIEYGGVRLSRIKLILQSSPQGAESFLIPNRIWTTRIENTNWERDNTVLEKFRVNTSSTNTYVYVDETVFVVLYKMENKFKKVIHYTKPASIEVEQTVWVKF